MAPQEAMTRSDFKMIDTATPKSALNSSSATPVKSTRGRILPSSTADVQAAIAAIQARSAALRRQTAISMDSLNRPDTRVDGAHERAPSSKRQSNTIDKDDIDNSKEYFSNIGALIDQVSGLKLPTKGGETPGDLEVKQSTSDISSDSDDSSLVAEGMVSTATQMNIGAFIDSLNAAAKLDPDQKAVIGKRSEVADIGKDDDKDADKDAEASPIMDDVEKLRMETEEKEEATLYAEAQLQSYIDKAVNLANRGNPKVADLEFIIFYARKKNVPIIPIIDAFDDAFDESVEEGEPHPATRLTNYIRRAVQLVEAGITTGQRPSQLLAEATNEDVDVSMLKSILANPGKHVKFGYGVDGQEKKENDALNTNKGASSENKENDSLNKNQGETSGIKQKMPASESKSLSVDQHQVTVDYSASFASPCSAESGSGSDEEQEKEKEEPKKVNTSRIYFQRKMEQLYHAERHFLRTSKGNRDGPVEVQEIDGVGSTKKILTMRVFKRHPTITPFRVGHWKLAKDERTRAHPGYGGVHGKSVRALAVQVGQKHKLEHFEWEKLGFELKKKKRLIDTANWFGK